MPCGAFPSALKRKEANWNACFKYEASMA
jgi:hypothetical protein